MPFKNNDLRLIDVCGFLFMWMYLGKFVGLTAAS